MTDTVDDKAAAVPAMHAPKARIGGLEEIDAVRLYMNRVGAERRSMLAAVVKEQLGTYSRDLAVIKLDKTTGDINVYCGDGSDKTVFEPTEREAEEIRKACLDERWPEPKLLDRVINQTPMMKEAKAEDTFEFRNSEGKIVMVQIRIENKEGGKSYIPFTYFDDEQWRCCEPDGALPLFGAEDLKGNVVAFIHEGAKAAATMRRMCAALTPDQKKMLADHPWGHELRHGVHLGWIGGALSPHRTDWSVLAKAGIKTVYIVADNDDAGRSAIPAIAQQIRLPTFAIMFTDEFPSGFDLADPFPPKMYNKDRYTGPSFHALLEPATWATDVVNPSRGGKLSHVPRSHFVDQWVYADEPELFICKAEPRIIRQADNLSKKLVKFSDSPGTARLLLANCEQVTTIAYAPDKKTGTVTVRGQRAFNVFRPSDIKPLDRPLKLDEDKPWADFLTYLFPEKKERGEVERWCATLIAKPEVRIHYGLLLVSKTQGVGKGIFASNVLGPLLGDHNVGYPSEHDVAESQFNDWFAHKRLAVVGEIYQGQSWKAYNRLKGVITDKECEVNKKHQPKYRTENWCHVIACSNSEECLKMDDTDRRWFYPNVAEEPWPREKFDEFIEWLASGGLPVVARWAKDYGDFVNTGDRPPMTVRKQVMIEQSEPEELRWVREYCADRVKEGDSFVISTSIASAFAKQRFNKTIYSQKRSFGLAMQKADMRQVSAPDGGEYTLKYECDKHRLFLSPAAEAEFNKAEFDAEGQRRWLREMLEKTHSELKNSPSF